LWFNSLDFAVFFATVFTLYWLAQRLRRGLRIQNTILLIASYFFYGYWDWRFLSLIFISTLVDFIAGLGMQRAVEMGGAAGRSRRRWWLVISMVKSLGMLGFFKYYGFFVDSFIAAVEPFGLDATVLRLDVVLPVGISFFTFQTMSYTIDIYRGEMKPVRGLFGFLDFALFVSLFPQLVAGPIERASALLPQVLARRRFDPRQFTDGLNLIFWGLFEKVFVADNLARFVDTVFKEGADPTGFAVIAGVWAFAFQIYCDFAGYSDIARGCAKCLGFELRLNFNHPYIAVNPSDFWRRWHISLSTWLRDYLYIPLGGNRRGTARTYWNLWLTMLLGGLWHGARWNFVYWGAYHGVVLMMHRMLKPLLDRLHVPQAAAVRIGWHVFKVVFMFQVVCVGWLLFRASNHNAGEIAVLFHKAFALEGAIDWSLLLPLAKFAGPLIAIDLLQVAAGRSELHRVAGVPGWVKCTVYAVMFYLFAFYGAAAESFIYFQF
jgi:D-alanyl-lipoteichoic acid acyltransferase DltB (MBOAT superfamily)